MEKKSFLKTMQQTDVYSAIKQSIYVSTSLACFAFVLWQSVQCIEKYTLSPQGTKLSLQHTSEIQHFPAITICPWSHYTYENHHLKRCGLSKHDYLLHGKWVGNATLDENCTNPRALFESIITKPEDLLSEIKYNYFEKSAPSVSSKVIRSHIDTDQFGRCFTFLPTEKMIKSGIREIVLGVRKKSRIFFHTNGMFEKERHGHITYIETHGKRQRQYFNLDFKVYYMLDFGGKPCENKPRFNHDDCIASKLEESSLEKYGCTTPFGANKDRICQDYKNGSKVMEMYKETMKEYANRCYSPCSFLSTKAIVIKSLKYSSEHKQSKNTIKLNENIQVFEAQYLYSALSMIAEVGGYVGLFLGISVNQVSALVNGVLDRFYHICKRKKRIY